MYEVRIFMKRKYSARKAAEHIADVTGFKVDDILKEIKSAKTTNFTHKKHGIRIEVEKV